MVRLGGKIAIVTGASSGIGEATAERFVADGAKVLLADVSDDRADELIAQCGGESCARFCRTDVASETDVAAMVEQAVGQFGGIDILFNNAGIGYFGGTPDLPTADWERILSVDLNSVFFGCRAAIPHLIAGGGGAIINTASVSGVRGDYNFSAYNAAKGAVVNYTRNLALDHGRDNIRVNAVCPGLTETRLARGLTRNRAVREHYESHHPMRRIAKADEVASVVAFLASDDASYVNGVILPVDGGMTASNGQPDFSTLLDR
ncbi:MAG: SDR family NAD(P)-dependent oxidoreductase [Pseudomonadota bacterium]